MPPKRQRSGTTTHATNGAPRSMASKKRKNLERSDIDDDSDFEAPFPTVVAQTKPQKKPSSKSRSKNHVPTLLSDSSSMSLENEKQGRRGGSTTEANGQEKEYRKGTVDMVRKKKYFFLASRAPGPLITPNSFPNHFVVSVFCLLNY